MVMRVCVRESCSSPDGQEAEKGEGLMITYILQRPLSTVTYFLQFGSAHPKVFTTPKVVPQSKFTHCKDNSHSNHIGYPFLNEQFQRFRSIEEIPVEINSYN